MVVRNLIRSSSSATRSTRRAGAVCSGRSLTTRCEGSILGRPGSLQAGVTYSQHQRLSARLLPRPFSTTRTSQADQDADAGSKGGLAQAARDNAAPFAESYVAQNATEALFKECAAQADYIIPQAFERHGKVPRTEEGEDIGEGTGWWYENIGLQPTFSNWCHVTFLHMWILMVRFRYFPDQHAQMWMQQLIDHFFFEAEHRMNIFHGISSRAIRNNYLKDVHNQWRGVQGAYDEGLIKGDAVLATAMWRNIFKGTDDVDWRKVALIVSFTRRALRALDGASDKSISAALVRFGNPMNEAVLVGKPSKGMGKPFSKEDEAALEEVLGKISSK